MLTHLQDEVDYPLSTEGQSVAYTNYSGEGGVGIGSFFRRLGFALRYSELNLLISNQLSDDSKLIMERNIVSRVKKGAPFLYTDNDPYLASNRWSIILDNRYVYSIGQVSICTTS